MRSDRLLELAAHLKSDRRGHKVFDFNCFSVGVRDPERHGCGSAGCAFGELPVVWPDEWEFGEPWHPNMPECDYGVRLKSETSFDANSSSARLGACEWFDLTKDEVHALFYPGLELSEISPIEVLRVNATAEQVADRFIVFVKWREEQALTGTTPVGE